MIRRPPHTESELILHDHIMNSARELCASETSLGADYANVKEGLFCDMELKKLFNVCSKDSTKGRCFDIHEKRLVLVNRWGKRDNLHRRALGKPYGRVIDYRGSKRTKR